MSHKWLCRGRPCVDGALRHKDLASPPTAFSGRTIRWSPQGFEWESKGQQADDIVEQLDSKGAPTAITKATEKGRRDIDDELEPHDAQTFRQAAGTGLCLAIDAHRFSLRCPP